MTLTRAVAAFLGVQLLATTWAVAYRLPYQFGGYGEPDHVLQDFWSHGTALSAPAPILAGLGLLALIARRRGKLGTTATAILLVLMALALIAGVLEPVVRQALRGDFPPLPRIGILVLTILDLVLAVVVLLAAGGQLRARVASDGAAKGAA